MQLQHDYDCLFFIGNLHAITVRQDPKLLASHTLATLATYLAAGINPDTATLFVQSSVSEHAELAWVLTCFTAMGELHRMTQFKDKSKKNSSELIGAGLFTYPVLMAADILLYQTQLVPVGEDQRQHLELTRDLAIRLNQTLGHPGFVVPEAFIAKTGSKIMSLQNPTLKMSKSDPQTDGTLFLSDPPATLLKKIKKAVTDSGSLIDGDPQKVGVRNLMEIQAALQGSTPEQVLSSYLGKQYGVLKQDTAEIVIAKMTILQKKQQELLAQPEYLRDLLLKGAASAKIRARKTLVTLYAHLGLEP